MPLLSFRPKQKAPASAPVEAPAPSAGKKARFDTDKEKDAAVKIQAIKRGQDQRKENSAKNVLQKPAFKLEAQQDPLREALQQEAGATAAHGCPTPAVPTSCSL